MVSVGLAPISSAEAASRVSDVVLTLSDDTAVAVNLAVDGGVTVRGEQTVAFYTPDEITVEGEKAVLANRERFQPSERVEVDVPAGLFQDAYGNLNERVTFAFVVTAETAPVAVERVRSAVLFERGVLEVEFAEELAVAAGNVTLERVRAGAEPVTSAALETEGRVLRVAYEGLEVNEEYVATLAADTVLNLLGNGNAATTLGPLRVQTRDSPELVMERCEPTEGSRSVALNTTVTLAFDQEVRMGECVVKAVSGEHYAVQEVELAPLTEGFAATHRFSLTGLEERTTYNLTVPAECFFNAYGIGAEAASFAFVTTRTAAPALERFNLRGEDDVSYDRALVFTFDQEVAARPGMVIELRPRGQSPLYRAVDKVEGRTVTVFNSAVESRLEADTAYTVTIPADVVCNDDNLCMGQSVAGAFTTPKGSFAAVVLQSTTPVAGAAQVSKEEPVVLRFTSNVRLCERAAAGVTIFMDDEPVEGAVTAAGTEVRMTFPLRSGASYTYLYDRTLVCTVKGAPVQYDLGAGFSFTVADTEGPQFESVRVNGMQNVVVGFNERVVQGAGLMRVVNEAGAVVVGPLHAAQEKAAAQLQLNINGQDLPHGVYTFQFDADFVRDLAGNPSAAYEFAFTFDTVAPFVERVEPLASSTAPLALVFNEAVVLEACVPALEEAGERLPLELRVALEEQTLEVQPTSGLWPNSTTLTLVLPAGCVRDLHGLEMERKEVTFETPAVVPLQVLGAASVPAMDSVSSVADVAAHGVSVAFDGAVELVATKLAQLRNADGCVVSDGAEAVVANNTVVFPVTSYRCLTGRIALVADEGAFVAVESGASSLASTAAAPLYAFSMMAAGPALLTATAVYAGSLLAVRGARIDLTFDRAVAVGGSTARVEQAQLGFVRFVDQHGEEVAFAAQFHGEVEGAVLRLVVDEPLATAAVSQIRVVRVAPVQPEEGIVAATEPQDACVGEATMARVFSLPPLTSRVEVEGEGPVSTRASFRITFDQAVRAGAAECKALVYHDGAATVGVPVSRLSKRSDTVFVWTMSAVEQFKPHTAYSMAVDQTCFALADAATPASGVGLALEFTTGDDTVGPEAIQLTDCSGQMMEESKELVLGRELAFCVRFNKAVVLRAGGSVSLRREGAPDVTVPSSKMSANPAVATEIRVVCDEARLAGSAVYTVLVDGIAQDAAGNAMRSNDRTFKVRTPLRAPYRVAIASALRLATGAVLVEFDAAVDSSLQEDTSAPDACLYGILAMPGRKEVAAWEDVCVGVSRTTPERLARVVTGLDAFLDTELLIFATTPELDITEEEATAVTVESDPEAVPLAPAAPELLAVRSEGETTRFEVRASTPYGFASPVLGLTFVVAQGEAIQVLQQPFAASGVYALEVPRMEGTAELMVKATTAAGASPFSLPLAVPRVEEASTAPSAVDVASVTTTQVSSSAVRVAWEAPVAREAILSYEVAVEGAEPLTATTTEVTLENLEAGEVRLTLTAVNRVGRSEPAEVAFTFSPRITAELLGVTTSASDAMARFHVSYAAAKVECALNAGHLIRAEATVGADNEAALFFAQLLPGLQYAGTCWAYATAAPEVSEAMSIAFTTLEANPEVALEVLAFEPTSRANLRVTVAVSQPARVACVAQESQSEPAFNELLQHGASALLLTAEPTTLELTGARGPLEQPVAAFCAAFNTLGQPVSRVVRSQEADLPASPAVLREPSAAVDGHTEVSVRPRLTLTFDRPVVCASGRLVLENLRTSEKMAFECGALAAEGRTLSVQVEAALAHGAEYTWYFAAESAVTDAAGELSLPPMTPGAHRFTTTTDEAVPTLTTEALADVPVDTPLVIQFSEAVERGAGELLVRQGAMTRAVEGTVQEDALLVSTGSLRAHTAYELVLGECLVVNAAGNCLPRRVLRFATLEDTSRPYVVAAEPARGATDIPNDVPVVLEFNEEVAVAEARLLEVYLNGHKVALDPLAVRVAGSRVEIDLEGAYGVASPSVESLQVEVRMKEGAFRDRADNKNEEDALEFTAKPLRCGSAYLASYMKDDCQCYSRMGRCVCDCGVNLFEL